MKAYVYLVLPIVFSLIARCPPNAILPMPTDESSLPAFTSIHSEAENTSGGDKKVDTNCKLFVRGEDISAEHYVAINMEKRYAVLPFTAVVEALGAKIEWESETTAMIIIDHEEYLLNVDENSLTMPGSVFNFLGVQGGATHGSYYQVIEGEFVVDSDSMLLLLYRAMGAKISINYDALIVSID